MVIETNACALPKESEIINDRCEQNEIRNFLTSVINSNILVVIRCKNTAEYCTCTLNVLCGPLKFQSPVPSSNTGCIFH